MLGVLVAPFAGRVIDRLVPWYATLIATGGLLVFQAVQTAAGGINVAAVVIACFGFDVARQSQQISMSTRVLRFILVLHKRKSLLTHQNNIAAYPPQLVHA